MEQHLLAAKMYMGKEGKKRRGKRKKIPYREFNGD